MTRKTNVRSDRATRLPALPCACANLRRAARAVTQLYDDALRPAGLRVTQFTLLQATSAHPGIGQRQLGEALALDSTTLTRMLGLLRRRGWIHVQPGIDRRERRIWLTPGGTKKLAQARSHWERAQDRLRRSLGEAKWSAVAELTGRVTAAARQA